ncbi:hypothetical protein MCOR29_004261 [Pyricularia oryzae]|nr:hypothetical protein MCOR29_004261 [Pyricularia oryzae]
MTLCPKDGPACPYGTRSVSVITKEVPLNVDEVSNAYSHNDAKLIFNCLLNLFELIYLIQQQHQLIAIDILFDNIFIFNKLFIFFFFNNHLLG